MNEMELYGFEEDQEESLQHEGVLERSGRWPWGSGEHPFQRLGGLYGEYKKAKAKGLKDGEIAGQLGISVNELRARNEYYVALRYKKNVAEARGMADKGKTNSEIAKSLGVSVGTVKNYLEASDKPRKQSILATRDILIDSLKETGMVDIGKGTDARMGIKRTALDDAIRTLYNDGYEVYSDIRIRQGGTNNFTTARVLCKPGTTKADVYKNKDNIAVINAHSEDGGLTIDKRQPPVNVDMKRVDIRYADDPISGADYDGVIELRRGVPDLDLGNAHYAQVRIAIDDNGAKRYAKGVAVYADDLPPGVDIRVNSNKKREQGPSKALKNQKEDPRTGEVDEMDPFGSSFHYDDNGLNTASTHYIDPKTGEKKQSSLNFVNDEGTWANWAKNLPSQFLSKQAPAFAKQQLKIDSDTREREFDQIASLTNPILRSNLLESFAKTCDSAAADLKAAALPRQQTHVILPARTVKENEVYAPRYEDGEEVCLVRFPHGGIFEIPKLKVNNRNEEAKKMISNQARDAVCINPKTANVLSGADFDGDTVLVLPTKYHNIATKEPFKGLKDFDPKTQYATTKEEQEILKIWDKGSRRERTQMGEISNLITDMTLQNAPDDELERAVRHSMVIIDTGKHKLNYRQSEIDNRISELKKTYQGGSRKGASTLISRAGKDTEVQGIKSYGNIDPETGEYIYVKDTELYPKRKKVQNPETGQKEWTTVYEPKERKVPLMSTVKDAYTLTSGGSKENPGTIMEGVYADYANRMKALANKARKESLNSKPQKADPTAKKTYAEEISHLNWQLNEAKKNAPLERKALALAEMEVRLAKQNSYDNSNPMSKDEESKLLDKCVKKARKQVGADRYRIDISPKEWEAIQSGAVPATIQKEIFRFADGDKIREYAMPKKEKKLSSGMLSTAQGMLDRGYTWAEVADRFGVSVSTLSSELNS